LAVCTGITTAFELMKSIILLDIHWMLNLPDLRYIQILLAFDNWEHLLWMWCRRRWHCGIGTEK
jgi:hypothetical protein